MNVTDINLYNSTYTKQVQGSENKGAAMVKQSKVSKSSDSFTVSPESSLKLENLQAANNNGSETLNSLAFLANALQ